LNETEDALTLSALLLRFRQRLEDPLLSFPDPRIVCRRLFQVVPSSARRSRRLADKGKGTTTSIVKRAQWILMQKLGLCHEEERLSAGQLKEYSEMFASPQGPEHVGAIAALFGLSCPACGEEELVVGTAA
jgi:hypothetical protein